MRSAVVDDVVRRISYLDPYQIMEGWWWEVPLYTCLVIAAFFYTILAGLAARQTRCLPDGFLSLLDAKISSGNGNFNNIPDSL